MKRFELFFEGGIVVRGSSAADWVRAPKTGVQAVVVCRADGAQEKISGFDYYSLLNNEIIGADLSLKKGFVKEGSLISDEAFAEIINGLEDASEIWNGTS